ncbi:hypothetical protein V8E36_003794 [Tilletia maclaganii]
MNTIRARPALPGPGSSSAPGTSPLAAHSIDGGAQSPNPLGPAAEAAAAVAAVSTPGAHEVHGESSTPQPPPQHPTAASLGLGDPGLGQTHAVHNLTSQAANSIFNPATVNAAAAAAAAAQQVALGHQQRKSTKATWSTNDDLELIRQLRLQRESHDNASKVNGGTPSILGNRGITWSAVEAGMEKYRQEKGSSEGRYDSLACRNRWQLLLLQYRVVADIRNQPGFVWSDVEGARMVPTHLWDAWVNQLDTAHKIRIAKIFRLKGFPLFNEVAALAGDPAFLTANQSAGGYGSSGSGSKQATPAANRARASMQGPNGQYNSPTTGNQWSANKRRNTGSGNNDDSFTSDSSFGGVSQTLDPNEQLIQQAQRRVRMESGGGLSISQKVTLTNLFRQDLTAVWTYMAIGENEDEFRLAWLREEVERVNSTRKAEAPAAGPSTGGLVPPTPAPAPAPGTEPQQ